MKAAANALVKAAFLLCAVILLTVTLNAQNISGVRFDFQFPSAKDDEHRNSLQAAYDRLSVKNPDLTGLSDEVISRGSEKDVQRVFSKLEEAKRQYEAVSDPDEKIFAYQVLNNYTQLFRAYRTLIKPVSDNSSTTGATQKKEYFEKYDNSRRPFRDFRIIRAEVASAGPLIEFEFTFDSLEFYAAIKTIPDPALAVRRWVIGHVLTEFFANGEEIRFYGSPGKPANGKKQLKQKVEQQSGIFVSPTDLTNSFMLDYARRYAPKVKIDWPIPAHEKMQLITTTENWIWTPQAKPDFNNEYRIKFKDSLGQLIHEELVTLKTGSDISSGDFSSRTVFDFSKVMYGIFGTLVGLGLIGAVSRFKKPDMPAGKPSGDNAGASVIPAEDTQPEDESSDKKARLIFDTSGRSLVILSGGAEGVVVKAQVVDADPARKWQFSVEMQSGNEHLDAAVVSVLGDTASIKVSEKHQILGSDEYLKEFVLKAAAESNGETVSRELNVVVGREGFFVVTSAPLKIVADGETVSELELTAVRYNDGFLETDTQALIDLKHEFTAEDHISRNAFETSEVNFRAESEWKNVRASIDACYKNNTFASLVYKVKTSRALPSVKNKGASHNVFCGGLKLKAPSAKGNCERTLAVELCAPAEPTRSERFAQEYQNCSLIIEKYVPPESGYQQKFRDMLEKHAPALGPEGLFKMRHDIWLIAQKLWEAQGLKGYVEIAERIETYDKIRNWAEWGGDMALSVVLYCKTGGGIGGTLSQTSITLMKQFIVSAINHYKDTVELKGVFKAEDCDSWLENQMKMLLFSAPDYMLTAASLKGLISSGRAAVLMFAGVFLRSMVMNIDWKKMGENWDEEKAGKERKSDICHAAWTATQECFKALGTMAVTKWITGVTVRNAIKNKVSVHRDVLKEYAKDVLAAEDIPLKKSSDGPYEPGNTTEVVDSMVKNIKNGMADADDVVRCLADNKTQAMRTIKSMPENVQNAFMKTLRQEFYEPHDRALIKHLEATAEVWLGKKYADGKGAKPKIRIDEMTTPSKKTAFSQDRDFCPKFFNEKTGQWEEISSTRHWKSASDSWWKKKTGHDAEALQQAAMTRLGGEACSDYATQHLNVTKGLFEVSDPHIVKVYAGDGRLKSPIELAAMYKNKIEGPLKFNNQAECIAQLKKGIQVYDKVYKSYQKQGYRVDTPPDSFKLAMEIMSWAPDDYRASPEVIGKLNRILSDSTGYADFFDFSRDLVVRMGQF